MEALSGGCFFSEGAYEHYSLAPSFRDLCERNRSATNSIHSPQRQQSKKQKRNEKKAGSKDGIGAKHTKTVVSSLLPTTRVPYPRYSWLSLEQHHEFQRLSRMQRQWDAHRRLVGDDAKSMEPFKVRRDIIEIATIKFQ